MLFVCIFSGMTMQRPIWFFAFCLFGPTVQCTMLCRVHIVACRLIYLIYLMDFSNRIEIWPSAGYLFCFLPDIYLCHQSKHLHFTTMTIYLFLFEGVQFDTVEIYIKNVAQYWKYRKYREGLVGKNIQVYVYLREKTDILCCFRAC